MTTETTTILPAHIEETITAIAKLPADHRTGAPDILARIERQPPAAFSVA